MDPTRDIKLYLPTSVKEMKLLGWNTSFLESTIA